MKSGRGSVASAISLRIPGYRAAEIQVDFTEEHKIFGTTAQNAILTKYMAPLKNRERTVHSKEPPSILKLTSAAPALQNLKTDPRNLETRAKSRVENGQTYPQAQRKGQSHLLLAFEVSVFACAILNETGGKRIRGRLRSFNAHAEHTRSALCGTEHCTSIQKPCNG